MIRRRPSRATPGPVHDAPGERVPRPSVLREQERLDAVTDVVLVVPVYWWSMPAIPTGWIDRVFIGGCASDDDGPHLGYPARRARGAPRPGEVRTGAWGTVGWDR